MPRPVRNQVVVITGASSGIGRETAVMLGQRGASVVLAARNEAALREVAKEIKRLGGVAEVAGTDVAEWPQVEHLAQAAVDRFGRIDTWVNNAAVSTYATVEELTVEEIERVLQVNLVGQIYGMKAALPHLARQGQGTIINVASALAERAAPLQAAYCAAKHGVKGFTEALRLELVRDHPGITVTLIEPSSINTPLFRHARSKLGVAATDPTGLRASSCRRDNSVRRREPSPHNRCRRQRQDAGASREAQPVSRRLVHAAAGAGFKQQQTDRPDDGQDNLFAPMSGTGSATGEFGQRSKATSLYTRHLELHPNRKRALNAAVLAGLVALMRRVGR